MRLLRMELKRVLKTRLNIVLLLAALALSVIMAFLPVTFQYAAYKDADGSIVKLTGMDALRYKQDVQADIAGAVTPEKVQSAVECYQAVMRKYGVKETYDLPDGVYYDEILPFAPLLHGVREAFADPNTGVAPSITEIDPERIADYYGAIEGRLQSLMKLEQSTHPAAQRAAQELFADVSVPYAFYPEYSTDALDYQILLAFLLLCISAVIAAPIFTSDRQTGADDILRCTKNGRARFAAAKVASALLVSGGLMLLCSTLYIVISDSLFGWESTKTSMQMVYSITNLLNMDVAKLQRFVALSGLLSVLATVCLILVLSARCKTVIVSLSSALVVCILPLIVYLAMPEMIGEWVYSIIPASGAGIQTSFLYAAVDFAFLNCGNIAVWLPHAMIGACVVELPLFIALTVYLHTKQRAF